MAFITNKIYICLPFEKEVDKLDWNGLSTEEYNGKTYYKIPSGGSSSDVVKKITFETLKDNVTVTLNIVSSSETTWDNAYACDLDGPSGYSNVKYKISGNNQSITCKYVVPTKGSHWIYIGYNKDGGVDRYNDCGYFSIDAIDKEYVIRQPKEVYLASDKMDEITYGSKKILEYGLGNTISWETLTWDKSNNSYTYNTNGPIRINYNISSVSSTSKTLNTSPSKLPLDGKIYKLGFYNSITSNNTYIMPYKIDLSDWDNSYVNDMSSMFYNFDSLNYINLSKLKNENITSTNSMFYGCKNLTILDVYKFNTSKVTDMGSMFYYCEKLATLDVSRFDTSNVTDMGSMFRSCSKLGSLDLSKWDTSNVTDMGSMFRNCSAFTSLDLSKWDTSNVTDMDFMFFNCSALTSLDLSKWDTSKVTDMSFMFYSCSALTSLDLSRWDTSKVTNMGNMFDWCSRLTSLDVSNWNVGNVTIMSNMFDWCSRLTSLDVSNWNVGNVTSMSSMFNGCSALTSLDLSKWNVSSVTNMGSMFSDCGRLTTLIDGHESDPNVSILNGLKNNISLKYATKLNYESVYALFRGLATVTGKTITLPKVMEGKLDADKVKIATDKGWTIKYS